MTILAFLFVLGVLIFVHELGHFLVARWYGVRVLTFSLGFGPKLLKVTRGGTEYCISAVPLGGYVKLAGETVEDNRTGAPDEFLSKSKWVRFQVYLAGPIMNILLAFFLTAGVLSQGADVPLYQSSTPVIGSIDAGSPAERAGLEVGDRIVSVNDTATPTWDALDMVVVPRAGRELTVKVDRDGREFGAKMVPTAEGQFEFGDLGIQPRLRPQIVQVGPDTPAERGGAKAGDVILAVAGQSRLDRDGIIAQIKKHAGQPLTFEVERAGQPRELTITPDETGIVGVSIFPYEVKRVDPTLAQAFKLSATKNWQDTVEIGRTLRGLVTRDTPVRQLVGPVAIAQLSGQAAELGWLTLFSLMSMISLNLGLLNLLPVPVLDGGHIAILAVEGAARRDLSMRVKERILMAGAAFIVLLMATVIFNDIARLFR